MQSSTFYSLAFLVGLSSLFSGCCGVPLSGGCGSCGSCGVASKGCDACPGLLHGELAGRVRNAVIGGCSSGCGEVYYGEQTNEPPTCDPCTGKGEFSGENCGPCRPLFQRLVQLWGTSYAGSCGCGSCDSGSCGSGSCGSDVYASQNSGSGYCPNCRDGVAGNPTHNSHNSHNPHHSHQHATPVSVKSQPDMEQSLPTVKEPTPMKTSSPNLEPIPDPVSDAPSNSAPTKAERSSNVRSSSTRTIQVPAAQPKLSRLVRE